METFIDLPSAVSSSDTEMLGNEKLLPGLRAKDSIFQ
jgi:hypothetical protein